MSQTPPYRRSQEDAVIQRLDNDRREPRRRIKEQPVAATSLQAVMAHRARGMSIASLKRIYGAAAVEAALSKDNK